MPLSVRGIERGGAKIAVVDFSPYKTCNFNCVYCGLGVTTVLTNTRSMFYPVAEVMEMIEDYYREEGVPDVSVLTGSGEPLLYLGLGEVATGVKRLSTMTKTRVITNGALLHDKEVRDMLRDVDVIQFNLDSVIEDEFRKTGRMHHEVKLSEVLGGAEALSKEYKGHYNIRSKFVAGFNDSIDNVQGLRDAYLKLKPDSVDVVKMKPFGAPDDYEMVSEGFCEKVREMFNGLPFPVNINL